MEEGRRWGSEGKLEGSEEEILEDLELQHKEDSEERRSEDKPQPQAVYLASQEADSEEVLELGHQGLLVLGSQVASERILHLGSELLPLLSVPQQQAASEETALMHKDNRQASELLRLLHSAHLLLLLALKLPQPLALIQEVLEEWGHLQGDSGELAQLLEDSVLLLLLDLEEVLPLVGYLVHLLLLLDQLLHLDLERLTPGLEEQLLPLHSERVLPTLV